MATKSSTPTFPLTLLPSPSTSLPMPPSPSTDPSAQKKLLCRKCGSSSWTIHLTTTYRLNALDTPPAFVQELPTTLNDAYEARCANPDCGFKALTSQLPALLAVAATALTPTQPAPPQATVIRTDYSSADQQRLDEASSKQPLTDLASRERAISESTDEITLPLRASIDPGSKVVEHD